MRGEVTTLRSLVEQLYKTRVCLSGFLQKGRSVPWLTRNPGIDTFRNRTKSFNACIDVVNGDVVAICQVIDQRYEALAVTHNALVQATLKEVVAPGGGRAPSLAPESKRAEQVTENAWPTDERITRARFQSCGSSSMGRVRPAVRMCSVHKLATRNGTWTIAAYRKVTSLVGKLPTQEAPCPYCVMRSPYPLLRLAS
jgi:hypothetical protein